MVRLSIKVWVLTLCLTEIVHHAASGRLPSLIKECVGSPRRQDVLASHAAWDAHAVHGVHATHSVSNLGTAPNPSAAATRRPEDATDDLPPRGSSELLERTRISDLLHR
jgi:hypothetical protein